MRDYKLKYMTAEQMAEIDKLWDEGHAESLTAFGWECANAWKEGAEKGFAKSVVTGAVIGTALAVAVHIGKFAWRKYQEKKLADETEPEVNEE